MRLSPLSHEDHAVRACYAALRMQEAVKRYAEGVRREHGEVHRAHPGRFALVKPVDPDDPAVADVIADWKRTPGTVGIRIMMTKEAGREPNDLGLDRILQAAVRHDFPVNMLCWGNVDAGAALIDRHPDTRFIIDHLAIMQPRTPPVAPQPWPICRRCWTLPGAGTR